MYEIYKSKNGKEFYFRLKAKNHQVILTSEGYKTRKACENGVASVQKNGGTESRFDKKVAKNGKHYFNLMASNGQIIGTSQMYASKATMNKGVASVSANAASKTVKDLV